MRASGGQAPLAPPAPHLPLSLCTAVRLEPLGQDRRHNRYWRLAGGEPAAQQAQQAQQEAAQQAAAPPGDRLLFEGHEDGQLSVVATSAALGALIKALERRGAREAGLYAALQRYREQIEEGMPAAPLLALRVPTGNDTGDGDEGSASTGAQRQQEEEERQALLDLCLSAPALEPRSLPSRSSKKAKEAAAVTAAVEAAAAADMAPLREGDSLAVTRIKLVGGSGGVVWWVGWVWMWSALS